jgi:hypothetical protein
MTAQPVPITSPAIERAKAACVSYLPRIEKASPGDGGSLKVPYGTTYVRVTCYHKDGVLVVKVSKPHHVRHYHLVFDEVRP